MNTHDTEKEGEKNTIQVLLQKNEFLNTHLAELSSEKKRYEEKTESLRRIIGESDNLIKELQERIFEKDQKTEVLTNTIALLHKEHANQILALQDQISANGSLIIKLNSETEILQKQLSEEVVQKKDKKIEELVSRVKRANIHLFESEKKMQEQGKFHAEEKDTLKKNVEEYKKFAEQSKNEVLAHIQVMQRLKEKLSENQEILSQKEKETKQQDSDMKTIKSQFKTVIEQNNETKTLQEIHKHRENSEIRKKEQEYLETIQVLRKELQEKEELLMAKRKENIHTKFISSNSIQSNSSQEDPELHNEVTAMIKMAMEHGDTAERIKVSLQNSGYKETVINECLKRIN